jgi:hypothetical protein
VALTPKDKTIGLVIGFAIFSNAPDFQFRLDYDPFGAHLNMDVEDKSYAIYYEVNYHEYLAEEKCYTTKQ